MSTSRCRAWVFTDYGENRPTLEGLNAKFLAVQREMCPTTNRLHWQGYVVFKSARSLGACKRLLEGAHWESRRGSHQQCVAYVTKSESRVDGPFIDGEEPSQGERNDLRAFAEAILHGQSDHELAYEFSAEFLRYGKYRNDLRMASRQGRKDKTKVVVLHGPSGCGKSRWAHDAFPEAYSKDPNNDWWDGYHGQDVVIVDEFYGGMRHDAVLKMCDRYGLNVQVKGGYVPFTAKVIIFTSNDDPRQWYSKLHSEKRETRIAFFRRIDYEVTYTGTQWWRNKRGVGDDAAANPESIDEPDWEPVNLTDLAGEVQPAKKSESGPIHCDDQ